MREYITKNPVNAIAIGLVGAVILGVVIYFLPQATRGIERQGREAQIFADVTQAAQTRHAPPNQTRAAWQEIQENMKVFSCHARGTRDELRSELKRVDNFPAPGQSWVTEEWWEPVGGKRSRVQFVTALNEADAKHHYGFWLEEHLAIGSGADRNWWIRQQELVYNPTVILCNEKE